MATNLECAVGICYTLRGTVYVVRVNCIHTVHTWYMCIRLRCCFVVIRLASTPVTVCFSFGCFSLAQFLTIYLSLLALSLSSSIRARLKAQLERHSKRVPTSVEFEIRFVIRLIAWWLLGESKIEIEVFSETKERECVRCLWHCQC